MKEKLNIRILVTFIGFCFLFLLVLSKAFYVQVINKKKLTSYSEAQFFRKVKVYPKRGNIFDRNGSPLAINIPTYGIFTIPKVHDGKYTNYKKLAKIVPALPYRSILEKIKDRDRYTWIARKVPLSLQQVDQIKKLEGIYLEEEPSRFYPNHEVGAQAIGFVGLDNSGLSGIEYQFNEDLKGKSKIIKYLQDAKGRPIKFEASDDYDLTAKDIHLSIDKDLQGAAEKFLKESVEQHRAKGGGVGIMDANTGELLAIANYPIFDPNDYKVANPNARKLSFVSDPFEPGSIFKTLTVASALEHKVARPSSMYFCENGQLRVESHIVKDSAHGGKPHGWLSVSDILTVSSNVGTTKIAFDLKFPKFKETLKKFRIGEKTNIEIPSESRGIFTSKENVSPLSLSNMSFGQGVAATPIQMLAAYAAIANGGVYVKPTMIKQPEDYKPYLNENNRVISKKTSDELVEMLGRVVEEGTGANAKVSYFKIGGKTTTAQKVSPNGGYDGYIGGFMGFPINIEDRFVIFAYVDNPSDGQYYGAAVGAPIFQKLAQYMLYKRKEIGSNMAAAHRNDKTDSKNPVHKASEVIDTIKTKAGAVNRNHGSGKIPNFVGLDKKSANQLAEESSIKIDAKGIGVVVSQKPAAGSPIDGNSNVELEFGAPRYE